MTGSARRALSALTALVMIATLFVGAPGPTYANGGSVTYYVAQVGTPDGDGSSCTDPDFVGGDQTPIAAAADSATDGDTIYICAGTYLIEATIDLVNELLTLQGAGAGVTTLDAGGDTQILTSTTVVTVSGLTFLRGNGNVMNGGGAISGTTVTVTNSTFWHNGTSGCGGDGTNGGAIRGETVTVTNSTFVGNEACFGGAITGENLGVANSTFIGNRASIGGASVSENLIVTNSTFVGNSASLGGAVVAISGGLITQSRFRSNTAIERGGAIMISLAPGYTVKLRGNVFTQNAAPFGGAITLQFCGTTGSRKKITLIKRTNRFVGNSATSQQGTKNIENWVDDCPT